ncbi:MAG: site-specific DNA-methyltransferase [Candidatus Hodarchaeota archaeon]
MMQSEFFKIKEVINEQSSGDNKPNRLIQGDNLQVMENLLKEGYEGKVKLIYIDPPFLSGEDYYTFNPVGNDEVNGPEKLAYSDKWKGDIEGYLEMLRPRLELMHELLSENGSIFVHLDWHACHYVKQVLLDEIFGYKNLVNEIIWHYGGPSPVKTSFPRKHDVIFFYAKSEKYTFYPQYAPMREYLIKRARKNPDGRLWVDQNVGKITDEKFQQLQSEGRIFKTKTGRYRRKQFLDEMEGDMIDDVWTMPIINSQAKERLGFPTQKPEALMERIIKCCTNPGDLVADFFCGSGTTIAVAQKMDRMWLGCDFSDVSLEITRKRLLGIKEASFLLETLI